MKPRLAMVTTLRDAADVVIPFIRYHQAIGFEHIFLFFDDPQDPSYEAAAGLAGVTCLRTGPELLEEQRGTPIWAHNLGFYDIEVMARQELNAAVAIARARTMGITWLLHIDIDELLYVPGHDARALFAGIDPKYDQVRFLNHEAVPETEPVGNPFREVSLFKRNPRMFTAGSDWNESFWHRQGWFFNGYDIGKNACRLAADPIPDGPHRFFGGPVETAPRATRRMTELRQAFQDEAAVLHYQTCGLSRFLQKYRTLGRFADKWFDDIPIPDGLHRRARDTVLDGSAEEAEDLYRIHVLLRGLSLDHEIERDRMFRVTLPAHLFGEDA